MEEFQQDMDRVGALLDGLHEEFKEFADSYGEKDLSNFGTILYMLTVSVTLPYIIN